MGVSGGHLNPAVTVSLAVVGKVQWRKVPHYLLAQYLGALLGAGLVLATYWEGLVWYEHHQGLYRTIPGTANIFTTFPSPHTTGLAGAADQLVSTSLLVLVICCLTDQTRLGGLGLPAGVAVTVLGLGTSLGLNCGAPLNPARDLAPRILCGETPLTARPEFQHKVLTS